MLTSKTMADVAKRTVVLTPMIKTRTKLPVIRATMPLTSQNAYPLERKYGSTTNGIEVVETPNLKLESAPTAKKGRLRL